MRSLQYETHLIGCIAVPELERAVKVRSLQYETHLIGCITAPELERACQGALVAV